MNLLFEFLVLAGAIFEDIGDNKLRPGFEIEEIAPLLIVRLSAFDGVL